MLGMCRAGGSWHRLSSTWLCCWACQKHPSGITKPGNKRQRTSQTCLMLSCLLLSALSLIPNFCRVLTAWWLIPGVNILHGVLYLLSFLFFFYLAWQQSGYYKVNATVRERTAVITPGVSSQWALLCSCETPPAVLQLNLRPPIHEKSWTCWNESREGH